VVRTDQQGDTCEYEYDLAGRLLSKDYTGHASGPLNGVTDSDTFTYDAASRMLTAVSGRYGNTVTYTYDTAGRKSTEALTISGQTYTVSTAYDAAGQVSG
jgi:YD repeat-containing protein